MRLLLLLAIAACSQAQILTPILAHVNQSAPAATTSRLFDGTGDYLGNEVCYNLGGGNTPSTPFTVAGWFKVGNTSQDAAATVINEHSGQRWGIIYNWTTNNYEFLVVGGSGDFRAGSQITIADSNWHHIAYRYDGTSWDYFLDGTKTVINGSFSGNYLTGSGCDSGTVFSVGAYIDGGLDFDGSIARVYLSTSALTDMQIATMAGATCSTSGVSGTVGYWLLGTASPEPESSPSPNTNSLTVNNATVSTGPSCSSE